MKLVASKLFVHTCTRKHPDGRIDWYWFQTRRPYLSDDELEHKCRGPFKSEEEAIQNAKATLG